MCEENFRVDPGEVEWPEDPSTLYPDIEDDSSEGRPNRVRNKTVKFQP